MGTSSSDREGGPICLEVTSETFHDNRSWKNRVEGEGGSDERYASRDEAIAAGRALAMERKVEHIAGREDGTVGEAQHLLPRPSRHPGLIAQGRVARRLTGSEVVTPGMQGASGGRVLHPPVDRFAQGRPPGS